MTTNHGAGWGGSSGDNRYGGTGYGSGGGSHPDKKPPISGVVIIALVILCPLIALGWLFIGDRGASQPKPPDGMSEQQLRAIFVASVKAARISYIVAMQKDAPFTDGEVEAMAAGNDFDSMRRAIEIADKINFGNLSPADMEQVMQLLNMMFQSVKVQINQNKGEKKHKKNHKKNSKKSKTRSRPVLLGGDDEFDIVQPSNNSPDPAKNFLQLNGLDNAAANRGTDTIPFGDEHGYFDEGGIGGEEAAPEDANAAAENINEFQNQNEDETAGGEAPRRLTKKAVKDVLRQNAGKFRSCYRRTLEQNPDVSGKLRFKFIVNQEGKVQDFAVLETEPTLRNPQMELHNPEMEDCLRENIENMTFPKFQTSNPDGNIRITYPMVFRTADE